MWFERFGSSKLVRGALHSHHSSSLFFSGSPPSSLSFPFILVFTSHFSSTCQFFLVWGIYSSYQSIRQSGWEKLDSMVWSMGSSGTRLHIMVLAAFSFVRLLHWVCPFLQALCEVLSVRSSSAVGLLGLSFGLLMWNGLGFQISGPTTHNSPSKSYFSAFSWGGGFWWCWAHLAALLKFRTLLLFVFFHLYGRCAELRGVTSFFTRSVSFDVSVLEARLHEDL